ncbi:MAG: redoxin domain-containing protein [Chloroflexi bacterium]|nr:redoxin domain-containing protein [Chloroflexota bacterium]
MTEVSTWFVVVLTFFVLAEAVAIVALARTIGLLQIRMGPEPGPLHTPSGLDLGFAAPAITGYELHNDQALTLNMHAGRWGIVFVSATCSVCRSLARDIATVGTDHSWDASMVVVARGSNMQNALYANLPREVVVFSDPNGDVHERYGVEEVPYAFLVADGHIRAKGVINSRDQLEMLLLESTRKIGEAAWVRVGEPIGSGEGVDR